MNFHKILISALLAGSLLAACGKSPSGEAGGGSTNPAAPERQALLERADSLLRALDEEYGKLLVSRDSLPGEGQAALDQQLAYLQQLRSRLVTRRDEIRVDQSEEWHFFRDRMRDSLRQFENFLNHR